MKQGCLQDVSLFPCKDMLIQSIRVCFYNFNYYSSISEARRNLPLTGLYNKQQKSVQSGSLLGLGEVYSEVPVVKLKIHKPMLIGVEKSVGLSLLDFKNRVGLSLLALKIVLDLACWA